MTQLAALVLLIFGFLPIANWIPGGHSAPWYHEYIGRWAWGGMISALVGLLAVVVLRSQSRLWREGLWQSLAARWRRGGRRVDAGIAAAVLALCAVVSRTVLSGKPLLIDEIISLYQARIFASGRLWLPAPRFTEFTSAMHLLDWNGKVYGQFPAGGPAMLAIGTLLHAEWLVGPVATAIGAWLLARLLRRIEAGDGVALAALLLYGFAPFTVFLGGSMMNHVTTTMWLIGAGLALAIATENSDARPRAALIMGLAFGIAATIRPTDAAAFALPAGCWLLWRARGGSRHVVALLASGVGVLLPIAVLLYINSQQTGSPWRFGYIEMWGKSHEIGFHQAPWGDPHTPLRGLELINLYLLRLQNYLFEAAGPSLLFATLALGLSRGRNAFDRWILAGSGLLLVAYFAYWHDGFYLGPRFILPLAPWAALWTARLPSVLSVRRMAPALIRGVLVAGVASLVLGAVEWIPLRAQQYRLGMLSMRFDVDQLAAAAGVENGVVLVRESWGAQMMARLWGIGVSRTSAEHIYRTTDACRLELAITATEREHGDSTALMQRLAPFHSDSAAVRADRSLPDTTVRFAPGGPRAAVCGRRIAEDRAGFTLFPPLLVAGRTGNVFFRDLHARDTLMLNQLQGRPIWLLLKDAEVGSALRFVRVPVDSLRREWAED